MPDTPTTDIAVLAQNALLEATDPEKIKALVFDQISKTVEKAVTEAVRSYSPFGRDLEKKIAAALSLNTLNLPNYNTMICAMVQNLVTDNVSGLIEARLKSDIAQMLKIAPRQTSLSAIVEKMTDHKREMDGHGEVTCHVEYCDPHREMWGPEWVVYLDETEGLTWSNRTHAEIKLEIWHGIKTDKKANAEDLNTGKIKTICENGRVIAGGPSFTTAAVYGLTGSLLSLYAAESIITMDEDDISISVGDD